MTAIAAPLTPRPAILALAWGVLCLVVAPASRGADWPQWRGPQRTGVCSEKGWNDHWTGDPKIAWKAQVGLGFSSFVVAQGRAFTMGHADEQDTVWAFDATSGRALWKHSYPAELGDKFFEGGTTGTPTVAGERVFTLSRWGDVFCFEAATGKVLWNINVQTGTGARVPDWGFAGAPLVQDHLLLLNVGESGLALDPETGKILWQSPPKSAGYATPLPVSWHGKPAAVLAGSAAYVAVNLADGKELWRVRWLTQYGVNASDPILEGDRLFLSTGYGKGAGLFQLGGAEPESLWKTKNLRTQLNGAVLYQGNLYGVDGDTTERATLKCLDFSTGTEKWAYPGFGNGGLIIADGRLIALSGGGELLVGPATPEPFKPAARAQVLGGKCWTAPVLANGLIYCRNSRGDVAVVDVRGN